MAETTEDKEARWIVRLARVLLESGKARGWSDAMRQAARMVRGA